MVSVSRAVMERLAEWWLGLSEKPFTLLSKDASSWTEAPQSEFHYGVRALQCPNRYNEVSGRLFAAWQEATRVAVRQSTQFSDRTGTHPCIRLVGGVEHKMRCGYCGAERERDDVCCALQAANQGRLHATCAHPPPENLTPEWLALYEEAAREALDPPVVAEQPPY